jgi:hypothetical protein
MEKSGSDTSTERKALMTGAITLTIKTNLASLDAALDRAIADLTYGTALRLVRGIDARLEAGYHYRDAGGRLLTELDQVVAAMLGDGLAEVKRAA